MKKQILCVIVVWLLTILNIPLANSFSVDTSQTQQQSTLGTSDYFSWKDNNGADWTTPVKDQMLSGPCWAFAACSILESVIKIRENNANMNPDISEQYILSCLPQSGGMNGGSSYLALKYMMETTTAGNDHNGAIPEWCFPYQETDEIPCSEKDERWTDQLIPLKEVGRWTSSGSSSDIQKIKDDIIEKGPLVTTIASTDDLRSWGYDHNNPDDYYPDPGQNLMMNHVVVLIGWKDSSIVDNGGYWICKNSWEPYWGYDGFFNIEYGALNIDKGEIIWVDYDPSFNYAPTAQIKKTAVGSVGEGLTFDASESFDADGSIAEYQWDFGDGSGGTGMVVDHTYETRGIYTVTLTVIDDQGKEGYIGSAALVDMWVEGDSWTYDIDTIQINYDTLGFHVSGGVSIPNLELKVSEITTDENKILYGGKVNGELTLELAGLPITATFTPFTKLSGGITMKRSDLHIQEITTTIQGMIKISIEGIPVSFPIPFDVTLNPILDGGISFIQFPIEVCNCWDTGGATVSLDGTISSFYLKVLKTANRIASLFGKEIISPEYAQLLPIIDISDFLDLEEVDNSFEIISHPRSFVCTDFEAVTVPAGTFDAYCVVLEYEHWTGDWNVDMGYHFSPEVAMITDASLDVGDMLFIHAELVETSIDD
jgi:C1A family cysteine protease/PKD repeat protein